MRRPWCVASKWGSRRHTQIYPDPDSGSSTVQATADAADTAAAAPPEGEELDLGECRLHAPSRLIAMRHTAGSNLCGPLHARRFVKEEKEEKEGEAPTRGLQSWTCLPALCGPWSNHNHACMPRCSQAREEFGGEEVAEAGPVDDAVAEEQAERKFPWSGEDRDYTYDELLGGCNGHEVVAVPPSCAGSSTRASIAAGPNVVVADRVLLLSQIACLASCARRTRS